MSREVLTAIADLRAEVRQLRAELQLALRNRKTPRQARYERRSARFRELAEATGLGLTYPAACALVAILGGARPAPPGFERAVDQLRRDPECPHSPRAIWRALADGD